MALPLNERAETSRLRAWARVALIALILAVLIVPHIITCLFTRKRPFARLFLRGAGWAVGADVRVTGTPVARNALYIVNHVSWIDILVLGGQTGTAFVAKADMESWPLLGWLADQNNTVYVKREAVLDVRNQATSIQTALRTGQPVALFPEGTTADGVTLLPFRSSLIAAVVPAPEGISIQPVAIDYGPNASAIAWTEAESIGKNALRIMARKGRLPVTLHFLEPLSHDDFANRKAIAAHSRAQISVALKLN